MGRVSFKLLSVIEERGDGDKRNAYQLQDAILSDLT